MYIYIEIHYKQLDVKDVYCTIYNKIYDIMYNTLYC